MKLNISTLTMFNSLTLKLFLQKTLLKDLNCFFKASTSHFLLFIGKIQLISTLSKRRTNVNNASDTLNVRNDSR